MSIAIVKARRKAQLEQNYLDQLRNIGSEHSKSHDPRFKKYLDKALQYATDTKVEKGKEVYDEGGLVRYQQTISSIKEIGKIANDQYNTAKKMYENHVKVHNIYQKIQIINQELNRYVNVEQKTLLLNDDSKALLEKLEDFNNQLKDLVVKNQKLLEDGFDKLGGIQL